MMTKRVHIEIVSMDFFSDGPTPSVSQGDLTGNSDNE